MKQSRIENLPYFARILFSTWLSMKDIAQLASTSHKLFFTMTGINLKNKKHRNALTDLSNQLKATSISRGFTWFQTITYSSTVSSSFC